MTTNIMVTYGKMIPSVSSQNALIDCTIDLDQEAVLNYIHLSAYHAMAPFLISERASMRISASGGRDQGTLPSGKALRVAADCCRDA